MQERRACALAVCTLLAVTSAACARTSRVRSRTPVRELTVATEVDEPAVVVAPKVTPEAPSPPISGEQLVAWYAFSGDAKDLSGTGNDGVVLRATPCEDRFGQAESAYEFDPSTYGYIDCGVDSSLEVGAAGSIAIWAYPHALRGALIAKDGPGYNDDVTLGYGVHGGRSTNMVLAFNRSPEKDSVLLQCPMPEQEWTHVVAVWSPAGAKLYVNGVVGAETDRACELSAHGTPLFMGQVQAGRLFRGKIDDVYIYGRALTTAEIQVLYHDEGPGK